jgi:RNA polymerase sigma-70 factor (ECF subfamily)
VPAQQTDAVQEEGAARLDRLLSSVSTGDAMAFSELYDTVSARVFGLIRRILIDQAQAEEVMQDVFLELWQSAGAFDPNKGRATTWILTLAHRRAVDRVRSAQAGRDRDARIGLRDLASEFDEVAETAEVRLEHERVEQAMKTLSEPQRNALQLAYYGGYTQAEIAERLQVPLGTVKTRLRDGMIRLRDALGVTP